jgi:ATP-dependent DNA helicase DinG
MNINSYTQLMIEAWQSACEDRPLRQSARVIDGYFVMTVTGNREQWTELCAAAGVPAHAVKTVNEATQQLTVRWPSVADAIFGTDGLLARYLPNYEPRIAQLHMARLVQRSIEMHCPALAEAGTGTGKSFAYLAVCLAMDKKVIVAAPTTALQMQLYKKDVPFLLSLPEFRHKKVSYAMGKNRYACRFKVEDPLTGTYAVNDRRFIEWYKTTQSGNLEELDFALDPNDRARINVDDDCAGRHCPLYDTCFYYTAKAERQHADVIITNHSLLALHCAYEGAGILPPADVLIVDEAHQLPDYVRNALGVEFTKIGIEQALHKAEIVDGDVDQAKKKADLFIGEVEHFMSDKEGSEVGVRKARRFVAGVELANTMRALADSVWNPGEMPENKDELRRARAAQAVRSMADNVRLFSEQTVDGYVRIVRRERKGTLTYCAAPYDVSGFIGRMCGVERIVQQSVDHTRCTRCHRPLTAAKIALLDGKPYGPDCIQMVDVLGDAETILLADWLAQEHPQPETKVTSADRPVIFTSATLAAPDFAAFKREAGLTDALTLQARSPFNYEDNALIFVPDANAPVPGNNGRDEHSGYVVETIQALVEASKGGAFLLFTSYASMQYAVNMLRWRFEGRGWPVYVQGELPKLEIVKRFREHGGAVLFATKSFWEGVDVQGEALRLVVIDKLPFEAPNPLNMAQEDALRRYAEQTLRYTGNKLQWYPFEALRVPKMIIDLKQGVGRLIRTRSDYGVIAILDPRVRKTQYGRNFVLPALPPAPVTSQLTQACAFLRSKQETPILHGDR